MRIWTSRRTSSPSSTQSPSPARSSRRTPPISTSMRSRPRHQAPGDVLGMHFFSPANVMKLLEVVRGAKTAPDVLATAMGDRQEDRQGRGRAGVCDGFIGNRMLKPRQVEAMNLLMEGALPAQVDKVHVDVRHADGAVPDERSRGRRYRLAPRPEPDRKHPRRALRRRGAGARRSRRASTTMTKSANRRKARASPN
jgi:hypothetical protein